MRDKERGQLLSYRIANPHPLKMVRMYAFLPATAALPHASVHTALSHHRSSFPLTHVARHTVHLAARAPKCTPLDVFPLHMQADPLHVQADPMYLAGDASPALGPYAAENADSGADLALDVGAGGSGGAARGGGSGGSSGSSGSGGADEDDEDLPADLREALSLGLVGSDAVARYRSFSRIPILGTLMGWSSFRSRMLADSSFVFKLMIQELVGNGTALASEIVVRGKHIWDELEYVASDLIVGTVVEAAFVWLLAPTLALPSRSGGSALRAFVDRLPANAFAARTALQSYTPMLRIAAFLYASAQYFVIGLGAGIVGTAITYGLIELRKRIDCSYMPKRPLPDVVPNSLAWGAFMAVSSNTRFQIVEGLERAIAIICGGTSAPAVNAGIVTLRFANNYWGGVQFIQFFRFLGLHAMEEEESELVPSQ